MDQERKTDPIAGSAGRPKVYEVLAAEIKKLGVPVFGLLTDDTMHLAATLDAMDVPFHTARHENNAICMADGFASASGKLGIALIGRGPALANGFNAAVNASRSSSKVLLLFGEAPAKTASGNKLGPDGKELDATSILNRAGVRTFELSHASLAQTVMAQAIDATASGPSALLLPVDLQLAWADSTPAVNAEPANPKRPSEAKMRSGSIEAAADVLKRCRKPLFVCGLGAHKAGAGKSIEALADKVGAVLATTLRAKDMFRQHPFNVGLIGSFSHSAGRRLMDEADCVVVFGASFNRLTTSGGTAFPQSAPVIHVDADRSHIGRWGPADIAVVGDARTVAQALIEAMPDRAADERPFHSGEIRRRLAEFHPAGDFKAESTGRIVDPRSLAIELDGLLPANRNFVYDGGNFLQVVPYLSVLGPDHLKVASDYFLSIGLGFGTALGFAKARPGQPTVLMVGDGGFLMALGELETVVREDIPLIIIVMNDCAYGAELHVLKMHQLPGKLAQFPDVDFAPVAEAFGFQAATVRSLDNLHEVAHLLRNPDGPVLLDCKINASIVAPVITEIANQQHRAG